MHLIFTSMIRCTRDTLSSRWKEREQGRELRIRAISVGEGPLDGGGRTNTGSRMQTCGYSGSTDKLKNKNGFSCKT